MTTIYDNLHMTCLTPDMHAQTCGYWYTVTHRSMAHTAFRTAESAYRWMWERGLRLTANLPPVRGVYDGMRIDGAYVDNMMLCEPAAWDSLRGVFAHVRQLSNADYTIGKLTMSAAGLVVVNYLNPNCHWRHVYDYRESADLEDCGAMNHG